MEVVKHTLRDRGPFGFYRGLSSMVYFATPKAAIRFSAFEVSSATPRFCDSFLFRDRVCSQAANSSMHKDGQPIFGGFTAFFAGLAAGTMEAIVVTTPQVAALTPCTDH